jgi:hypothetical protein
MLLPREQSRRLGARAAVIRNAGESSRTIAPRKPDIVVHN